MHKEIARAKIELDRDVADSSESLRLLRRAARNKRKNACLEFKRVSGDIFRVCKLLQFPTVDKCRSSTYRLELSDYGIQLREPHKVNEIMKCLAAIRRCRYEIRVLSFDT